MIFENFRNTYSNQICFTSNQVLSWYPGFDKNNLGRWVKKGYIIKLRNGFYAIAEQHNIPNFNLFIANRIYRPSYISLYTALSFYGLIPEAVVQTISVSTLKTARFNNEISSFLYKSVNESIFFGFNQLPFSDGKSILMATPEKALLDLLYLYPFYKTGTDILNLRLDEDLLSELLDTNQLYDFLSKFENKSLEKRVNTLLKVYTITK
jgi:predicted transcriptional regulator of viral defense system